MNKVILYLCVVFCLISTSVYGQIYNIVIKGGHVIDPKNQVDQVMDVAVKDGKIVRVAKNIDGKEGAQVVDASGFYVVPGLIDMHVHVFNGVDLDYEYWEHPVSIEPDGFTFRVGVTTVVDAGGSGWRTFPAFKRRVIDVSQTRVLAFLNILGTGMRGVIFSQNLLDMDSEVTGEFARKYPDDIVGIKLAHFYGPDWTPTEKTVAAGKLADIPVMIDFGGSNPHLPLEELFMDHLRPGDIFTHTFTRLGRRENIVDRETKILKPYVKKAQNRGIVFDVGYGALSFAYSQAIPALNSGFYPDVISTDIHTLSMNSSMKDMLTTMSKFLAMGMDLQSVIKASTWTPARVIGREELGNLSPGAEADIAILNIRKGRFGLFDPYGDKIETGEKFECEMTIRAGKIVYDLNGIADPLLRY